MKKVLFIDDEKITEALCSNLEQFAFYVTHLQDYSLLDNELTKGYDAIILDVMMPICSSFFSKDEIIKAEGGRRTGIVLFDRIRIKYPKMPVVFYSSIQDRINCDEYAVIASKPQLTKSLAKIVNDLIEKVEKS